MLVKMKKANVVQRVTKDMVDCYLKKGFNLVGDDGKEIIPKDAKELEIDRLKAENQSLIDKHNAEIKALKAKIARQEKPKKE